MNANAALTHNAADLSETKNTGSLGVSGLHPMTLRRARRVSQRTSTALMCAIQADLRALLTGVFLGEAFLREAFLAAFFCGAPFSSSFPDFA